MRRRPGNERRPKAALLSACEGGSTGAAEGAARLYRRGCKRGPDIVRFAKEQGSEVIVLTAPHVDPAQPTAGWGSLSYKVGLFAPCPVLLVK